MTTKESAVSSLREPVKSGITATRLRCTVVPQCESCTLTSRSKGRRRDKNTKLATVMMGMTVMASGSMMVNAVMVERETPSSLYQPLHDVCMSTKRMLWERLLY